MFFFKPTTSSLSIPLISHLLILLRFPSSLLPSLRSPPPRQPAVSIYFYSISFASPVTPRRSPFTVKPRKQNITGNSRHYPISILPNINPKSNWHKACTWRNGKLKDHKTSILRTWRGEGESSSRRTRADYGGKAGG